jgi:hypothetical protein
MDPFIQIYFPWRRTDPECSLTIFFFLNEDVLKMSSFTVIGTELGFRPSSVNSDFLWPLIKTSCKYYNAFTTDKRKGMYQVKKKICPYSPRTSDSCSLVAAAAPSCPAATCSCQPPPPPYPHARRITPPPYPPPAASVLWSTRRSQVGRHPLLITPDPSRRRSLHRRDRSRQSHCHNTSIIAGPRRPRDRTPLHQLEGQFMVKIWKYILVTVKVFYSDSTA